MTKSKVGSYTGGHNVSISQTNISLTWMFCHNLVKIHLVVIEILSFSCSVLLVVKADGYHLAVPNCKKSKWLNYCNTKLVQFP